MRAVNLLPAPRVDQRQDDSRRRERTTKAIAIAGGLVLVFVTAALVFAFMHERSVVNDRQSTLDGLHAKVAQSQAKAAQSHAAAASSAAVAAATQAQITAIKSAASGRVAWDDLLNQLSRVMPSGASLVTLQANDGNATSSATTPSTSTSSTPSTSTTTSSAPASSLASSTTGSASAPTSFVVTGYALSQATVAQVLDRLALIPALSDVSLQSTQRTEVAGTNTNALQFTIGASLRSAGGTPQ
jgi:Tfp pilus assembly protein PilN